MSEPTNVPFNDEERPGVVEPQPDTLQPDVQALPDMSAEQSDRFLDPEAEAEDAAQREHMIKEKNKRH